MARLPVPGSDEGIWGDVLNEYLSVSHTSSGTLKNNAVDSSSIQNSTITPGKLSSSNNPSGGQMLSYNGTNFTWVNPGSGSVDWGDIGGTLSDQTDLQTALGGKANTSHTHAIADVTNLQTTLDGKANTSHNHSAADITSGTLGLDRLSQVLAFVDVSTGSEARPANAERVLWIGGDTEPTNIDNGDVWLQEA